MLQVGMEVLDVLDLAGLSNPISVFLEPSSSVKS